MEYLERNCIALIPGQSYLQQINSLEKSLVQTVKHLLKNISDEIVVKSACWILIGFLHFIVCANDQIIGCHTILIGIVKPGFFIQPLGTTKLWPVS